GIIGHIGGDDIIFIVPFDASPDVCGEVLEVFDTLIPYQYNEQDRRAGYYFGKDRRGQLHRAAPCRSSTRPGGPARCTGTESTCRTPRAPRRTRRGSRRTGL